jgi:ech hydrogenase subunit D
MKGEVITVTPDTVVGEAAKMRSNGYRFVTMSCMEADEHGIELLYHFDKNLEIRHLRLSVSKSNGVPSVSQVYFAAFLVENEIQDLFGIKIDGIAIDYGHTLYMEKDTQCPEQ